MVRMRREKEMIERTFNPDDGDKLEEVQSLTIDTDSQPAEQVPLHPSTWLLS
jgi:hypothetical protein